MLKTTCRVLLAGLLAGATVADEAVEPQPAEAPRPEPRLTSPQRYNPATAVWEVHGVPTAPAPSPATAGTPTPNPRYGMPVGPAPQVGYAPQVGGPLPSYPGVPPRTLPQVGQPSRMVGAGPMASLFTDLKAGEPGDVLTIVITAQAVAAAQAAKNNTNQLGVSLDGGSGLLSFLPSLSVGLEAGSSGSQNDSSSFNVATTFTVVVTEVLPNGNLKVAGEQVVEMDGRPQYVKIVGEVRPYDVSRDNTIESTKVANVHIDFLGVKDKRKRKGLFDVIGGAIQSLFGLFF